MAMVRFNPTALNFGYDFVRLVHFLGYPVGSGHQQTCKTLQKLVLPEILENSVKLTIVEFEALPEVNFEPKCFQKSPSIKKKNLTKNVPMSPEQSTNPFHIFTQIRQFSCTLETVTSDILHVYNTGVKLTVQPKWISQITEVTQLNMDLIG